MTTLTKLQYHWLLRVLAIVCVFATHAAASLSDSLLETDWKLRLRVSNKMARQALGLTGSANKRRHSCQLSLHRNGTFALRDYGETSQFVVRGVWELGRNPYCPTDRFYHDLLLDSYPRVLIDHHNNGGSAAVQCSRFQAKCRIYATSNRNRMRIRHGCVLMKQSWPHSSGGWWRNNRRVVGSFEIGRAHV